MASLWNWRETPVGKMAQNSGLFGRYIAFINSLFNENHAWFDYNEKFPKDSDPVENFLKGQTGSGLTNADIQANEIQMQNQEDIYGRQVAGMQKAGLNPALMFQSGASSAPSVSPSQNIGNMSELLQALMIPLQMKLMNAEVDKTKADAKAALMNAGANVKNAETNEGNLDVNRGNLDVNKMNAETNKMRASFEKLLAESNVEVNKERLGEISANAAQIRLFTEQMPERLELAKQEADAKTTSALASLNSSLAAIRQAAVAEKLSDSEIALREAMTAVQWANKEGQDIINSHLDEKTIQEIDTLAEQAKNFDASARNLDRNAKVQWTETIAGYLGAGARIMSGAGAIMGAL